MTMFGLVAFVVVFVAGAIVFAMNKKDRGNVPNAMDPTRRRSGSEMVWIFITAFILIILIPGIVIYRFFRAPLSH